MKTRLILGMALVFLFSLSIGVNAWGAHFNHALITSDIDGDGWIYSTGGNTAYDYKGDLHIEGRWEQLQYKYRTSKGDPYNIDHITNYVTRTSVNQGITTEVTFLADCERNGTFYHEAVELSYTPPSTSDNAVLFNYLVNHADQGHNPRAWIYVEKSNPKILLGFFRDALAYSTHFGNNKTWSAGEYWY